MRIMSIASLFVACVIARVGVGAELLDDPTRPSNVRSVVRARSQEPHEPRLEGTFRRDERLVAIIDGRVVHVGERIADVTIEEITVDAVRYSRGGHDHTVRILRTTLQVRRPDTSQARLP